MTTDNKPANSIVYQNLRQQILRGRLFPGAWLREQNLVEEFNVSRTPIREALRRLESEGLIEVLPYRGARVTSFGAEDFQEEYTIRAALEGFAIELAVPRVSAETIAELEIMADEMEKLLDEGNLETFLEINRKFHMTLYRVSGSQRLVSMIESSWNKENLYRIVFLSRPAALDIEKAIHRDMIEACRQGDSARARRLTQQALLETASLMRKWESPEG